MHKKIITLKGEPKMIRFALQLFALMVLSNAAVIMAENIQYHHCYFDKIHRKSKMNKTLQVDNPDEGEKIIIKDDQASSAFDYLRVKFSMNNFDIKRKYCKEVNDKVKDVRAIQMTCQEKDILNTQKKNDLMKIVRSAINMHTSRLKVKRLQNPIKVPKLRGPLCRRFKVPESHKKEGVKDADMVLYVLSRPSSNKEMFAAGAPCVVIPNGRPVVGVLMYTTEYIKFDAYNVRVAAHEIAHALGFTYAIMKNKIGNNMKMHTIREKDNVEEIRTPNVVKFAQKQYGCQQSWGVELEDEKGILSVSSHSHWKRRNVLEELMAPIVTTGYYSYLTLALFQDLGFYEASLTSGEEMEWGKGAGCDFLRKKCIGDGVDNSRYFCSERESTKLHCIPGRRGMGTCSNIVRDDQLPKAYQYFWQYNAWRAYYEYYTGEESLMTDRCPIYEAKDDLSCTDRQSKAPGIKGCTSWCVRSLNGVRKDGHSDRCAAITIHNDEVHIHTGEAYQQFKCVQKGQLYTATFKMGSKILEYECPDRKKVEQEYKLKTLIEEAANWTPKDDF